MQEILVPVDFSESTPTVLKIAQSIGYKSKSNVTLWHAIETHLLVNDSGKFPFTLLPHWKAVHDEKEFSGKKRKIEDLLSAEIDKFRNHCANCKYVIQEIHPLDKPGKMVLDYIQKNNPSLLIIGSNGIGSSVEYQVFGSNTKKIIQNTKIPVLVAKNGSEWNDISKILFIGDFTSPYTLKHFSRLVDVFKNYDVKYDLLFINTPSYFCKSSDMEEGFDLYKKQYPSLNLSLHIVNDFSVEKGVMQFLSKNTVDLISLTMLPHNFQYFFQPHICEIFIRDTQLPVFIIPFLAD